jgi:putative heme iron utilization protein
LTDQKNLDAALHQAAALALATKSGTLATVEAGQPNAALVTLAWLPDATPLLLLSSLAVHTSQLRTNPACALLLTGPAADENPQTAPRLALSAQAGPCANPGARAIFLKPHPYASLYIDFTDFAFWQLTITKAQYIGGFAASFHLNPAALRQKIIELQTLTAVDGP